MRPEGAAMPRCRDLPTAVTHDQVGRRGRSGNRAIVCKLRGRPPPALQVDVPVRAEVGSKGKFGARRCRGDLGRGVAGVASGSRGRADADDVGVFALSRSGCSTSASGHGFDLDGFAGQGIATKCGKSPVRLRDALDARLIRSPDRRRGMPQVRVPFSARRRWISAATPTSPADAITPSGPSAGTADGSGGSNWSVASFWML